MSNPKIGFIGFGEAAAGIAEGLVGEGVTGIAAFDPRPRPQQVGVTMAGTIENMLAISDIVFAAVTCTVALDVARQAAPFLTDRHLYVDINSVSPDTKIAVGTLVMDAGARYVEAAVMAGVPGYQHKVPMLLSGEAAPQLIAAMTPLGMELEDFGPELGRASALKMFRSIMIKGMEALFQECVLGAEHYGVAKKVLDSIADGYPGIDWDHMAHHLIGRTAIHGERRAHEMDEVADTLRAIGIDPIMSEAASKRIMWAANKGLKETFPGDAPKDYRDVIKAIHAFDEKIKG
ncbi:MAG: NAD(P)-dependent oxidoreductase [Rhodospirillales bacterium]|nr:NAD(P)-dependent oxidoreductase [Rhodospirillales bacterium]